MVPQKLDMVKEYFGKLLKRYTKHMIYETGGSKNVCWLYPAYEMVDFPSEGT